ncbi:MAG: bidirectional hydrogenase complex protein HoxU [Brevinematia bacterium]
MSVVTLKIDDVECTGEIGKTILQVAMENKINIPVLCNLEGLTPVAACRLCLVEVEGIPKFVPACATKVSEGMVVRTNTEKLKNYRRMVVELLFAEGNHICASCVVNGHCELQDLGYSVGMDHVRFDYLWQSFQIDASHPKFVMDQSKCVKCTRCIRVCDEVEGAHVWDLKGRGISVRVSAGFGEPWGQIKDCTQCGKCVQVCPVGALFDKTATSSEMVKDRTFLQRILEGREARIWVR